MDQDPSCRHCRYWNQMKTSSERGFCRRIIDREARSGEPANEAEIVSCGHCGGGELQTAAEFSCFLWEPSHVAHKTPDLTIPLRRVKSSRRRS